MSTARDGAPECPDVLTSGSNLGVGKEADSCGLLVELVDVPHGALVDALVELVLVDLRRDR